MSTSTPDSTGSEPVLLDPGICPPEARFPASIEARHANNDPAQCVPVDPCMSDGTGLWTALPCEPSSPVPDVTVAVSAPPVAQLPATGLVDVGLVAAGIAAVAIGSLLRFIAADRRCRQGNAPQGGTQ